MEEVEDHSAMETILGDTLFKAPVKEHWSRKGMDKAQVEEDARDLFYISKHITSQDSLERYAQYIMDFTTSLSKHHGKKQHLTPRCHSWWSPEVARSISSYHSALWGRDTDRVPIAQHQQNSTICHAKAASFCGFFHLVAEELGKVVL